MFKRNLSMTLLKSPARKLPPILIALSLCLALFSILLANQAPKTTKQTPKLVELIKINPNIKLDIRYATKNNFTKQQVYPVAKCYVQDIVAKALDSVQKELEKQNLGLLVFDGYRPFGVQEIFWKICPNSNYVAKPDWAKGKGSKHNRGTAVDLTLIDLKTGKALEMPSEFDDLTPKANRTYNTMSKSTAKNCKLLEDVMVKNGFEPLSTEWWHFDYKDWKKYPLMKTTFDELLTPKNQISYNQNLS
ncbi:MAG: M15 family metallopeptidase [bacterium]